MTAQEEIKTMNEYSMGSPRAEQLLHLASRCEVTLNLTRIQIVGIKAGGLESSVDPVVEALRETVRRAEEVQEELQKLGY